MKETTILDTPDSIDFFRLATMVQGLKLECKGMRISRGPTCYAMAKREFNLKGSKEKVLAQLTKIKEDRIAVRQAQGSN